MLTSDYSGANATINTYDEYGIPGSGNTGRFQYTGQVWLDEIGMYYYKARMYSPTLGRFLQTDPIGYDDQFNLYAYVGNDPINRIDPTGMITRVECKTGDVECSETEEGDQPGNEMIVHGDRPKPLPIGVLRFFWASALGESPQSGKDDPPPCNLAQRGLQKLGSYGVRLGGDVTTAGLAITGGGLAVAGVSASTVVLAPGGVLLGGSIATGGANVTAGGGVIGTGGALLMLAGGSGKAAVPDLASRVVSSRIPKSFGGEIISNLVGKAVDAIPFEFRICK